MMHDMIRPLADIRVIEIGRSPSVCMAGALLTDLGADVVRLDTPEDDHTTAAYRVFNRGKASASFLAVDDARGAMLSERLDVVLSEDDVAVIPRAAHHVRCVMPSFPKGFAGRGYGNDPLFADAYAGLLTTTKTEYGGPGLLEVAHGPRGAGALAAFAVSCCIYGRNRTGRGADLEVTWLAGAVSMQMFNLIGRPDIEPVPTWPGDPRGWSSALHLYEAADGKWLYVGCPNTEFWAKLCVAIDRLDLAIDPRLEEMPYPRDVSAHDDVKSILDDTFRTRSAAEWIARLEANDCIAGPVLDRNQWLDHPQVVANNLQVRVHDPVLGETVQAGPSLAFDGQRPDIRPAPQAADLDVDQLLVKWSTREFGETTASREPPLAGATIIDLGVFAAGPLASRLLADMGAQVTKVEPIHGDTFRRLGLGFAVANRGKQTLGLNLRVPEGLDIMRRLIADADALITNWRPAALEERCLTPADVHQVNDKLIHVAVSGFGATGPWSNKPCIDLGVQAVTGWCAAQGGGRSSPAAPGPWPFDNWTPHLVGLATVAGLIARQRGERAVSLRTSMVACAMTFQLERYLIPEPTPCEPANREQGVDAAYRLCATKDGWLLIAARSDQEWATFCGWLGKPAMLRSSAEAWAAVSDRMNALTTERAISEMAAQRIPCVPLQYRDAFLRDIQARSLGMIVDVPHPEYGALLQPGQLVKFANREVPVATGYPNLGPDTDVVLARIGLDPESIDALRSSSVVS